MNVCVCMNFIFDVVWKRARETSREIVCLHSHGVSCSNAAIERINTEAKRFETKGYGNGVIALFSFLICECTSFNVFGALFVHIGFRCAQTLIAYQQPFGIRLCVCVLEIQ